MERGKGGSGDQLGQDVKSPQALELWSFVSEAWYEAFCALLEAKFHLAHRAHRSLRPASIRDSGDPKLSKASSVESKGETGLLIMLRHLRG